MMTNASSVRASTAALMRSTISLGFDQRLARPMPAALGLHLVLEVDRRDAGRDHVADRAGDVERAAAEAGVGVDQQRQLASRRVIRRASSSTSFSVVMPRSGSANDALATPAPDR